MVSGVMAEERMSFKLPPVNANTAPAAIKVRAIDKKVNEGVLTFGANKGKPYKSVVEAHEEIYVKNYTKAFKK